MTSQSNFVEIISEDEYKIEEDNSELEDKHPGSPDESYFVYCNICSKTIPPSEIKSHLRSHKTDKCVNQKKTPLEYSCRYCGLIFDKVNNRTSHEIRIHKNKKNGGYENFQCKDCSSFFKTQEQLREHTFIHFKGKVHHCDFQNCDRKFKKGKLLTVHKKCHFEPQVKCADCGHMFVQRAGLLKHQKFKRCPARKGIEESAEIEFTIEDDSQSAVEPQESANVKDTIEIDKTSSECEVPDVDDSEEPRAEEWHYEYLDENLADLVEEGNESNPFEEIEPFEIEREAEEALEIAEDTRPQKITKNPVKINSEAYECDFCAKKFTSRTSIFSHLLVTHKVLRDYNCTICYRKFKSQGNLSRHTKAMHNEEKHWNCDKCGALFKEAYQLEIHSHNHDQPTKCKICGRMVANIKVHLRHHAAKGNNVTVDCPLCEKKIGKYQLIRHIKSIHEKQYQKESITTNLKVYSCNECGEFFSRRQELRQHEYISHSQNKIYECSICGTVFKKLKLLNVHRFTHQPLNVKCKFCDKVYARKAALYKHTKKNHPDLYANPKEKPKN